MWLVFYLLIEHIISEGLSWSMIDGFYSIVYWVSQLSTYFRLLLWLPSVEVRFSMVFANK